MKKFKLIDDIYRKKREEKENVRKVVLKKTFRALSELKKVVSFKEAYIFGSLSKPYAFCEDSDVDIAFLGLPEEKIFFAIAFLSDFLERDVDVVMLEKSRLKDKIIKEGIKWKPEFHF